MLKSHFLIHTQIIYLCIYSTQIGLNIVIVCGGWGAGGGRAEGMGEEGGSEGVEQLDNLVKYVV